MYFGYTPEQVDFQRRVQNFIAENFTQELETGISRLNGAGDADEVLRKRLEDAQAEFKERLDQAGLLRGAWPVEFGGEGKSLMYQYIMNQELELAGLAREGLGLQGPVIERYGSDEQKEEFLPGILSGEITFSLGFTEPRGGTDLAGLETKAVRDGADWIVNGQKIFTTGAHKTSHLWLLARTDRDAPKHQGISIFMVDMKSPGITVRPLWTMGTYRTNEVFLDDVRVSNRYLVGEENRGWYYNTMSLDLERVGIGAYGPYKRFFDQVVAFAKETRLDGKPLAEDPVVRLRLGELAVDIEILRHISEKNAWLISEGEVPYGEAAMAKIWSTELYYRMTSMVMQFMGPFGQLQTGSKWVFMEGEVEAGYRNSPPARFGGGGSEVLRDIVARRHLGLPRS